jgi:hypothetical protein
MLCLKQKMSFLNCGNELFLAPRLCLHHKSYFSGLEHNVRDQKINRQLDAL